MTRAITLELPENLYRFLEHQASLRHETLERIAISLLEHQAGEGEEDPVAPFIGAFDSGVRDLSVNHDAYLSAEYADTHVPEPNP